MGGEIRGGDERMGVKGRLVALIDGGPIISEHADLGGEQAER